MFAENGKMSHEKKPLVSYRMPECCWEQQQMCPVELLPSILCGFCWFFPPGSFFWADPQQSMPSPHLSFAALPAWSFSISLTAISAPIKNNLLGEEEGGKASFLISQYPGKIKKLHLGNASN